MQLNGLWLWFQLLCLDLAYGTRATTSQLSVCNHSGFILGSQLSQVWLEAEKEWSYLKRLSLWTTFTQTHRKPKRSAPRVPDNNIPPCSLTIIARKTTQERAHTTTQRRHNDTHGECQKATQDNLSKLSRVNQLLSYIWNAPTRKAGYQKRNRWKE